MRTRDPEILEWLDGERLDDSALRENLADIRRINALLGWTRFTAKVVLRSAAADGKRSIRLLDVASGSADIPLAIVRRAVRARIEFHATVTDINPQIVAIAREHALDEPCIRAERQNALALSYAPGTFDIGLCTLALHHFDPDAAIGLLQNLKRVSRRVLVFDVQRSRAAHIGAIVMTRALRMNAMTRHDAPASVRRAYSATELREMAHAAGFANFRVWVGFPFRLALEAHSEP